MPRVAQKTLSFPLAGVVRRGKYKEQQYRPYTAPWAINVRSVDTLERRLRGGSRPGLAKINSTEFENITALIPITSVDSAGSRNVDLVVIADGAFYSIRGAAVSTATARLLWDDDEPVLWEDGEYIVFDSTASTANPIGQSDAFDAVERNGKLYLADSVLKVFDPNDGVVETVVASAGTIPTGCPLVTVYRDRLFLAGADHLWYASRQSDPTDWNFGADMGDQGRAVAGAVAHAGRIGDVVQAMIPHNDSVLIFATKNELWALRGDPGADGSIGLVSAGIGIISPTAWAKAPDGTIAFLSNDGVYLMPSTGGEHPMRWSEERVPDELRNIDPDGKAITMAYDSVGIGYHLFITPADGVGEHWWLDVANKAIWPVVMQEDHQPIAVSRLQGETGLAEVVLGCMDGYLRKFSDAAATDDGEDLASHVLLGPIRLTNDDLTDAMLTEIHGMIGDGSGETTWKVITGNSAEDAADKAVAAMLGAEVTYPSGKWEGGRNRVQRPRTRGPWMVVWIQSREQWAFEAVAIRFNMLGRVR